MTATTTVQVVGVQDAIKQLRRIDPELRKQFNRDAKDIAAPAVRDAQRAYPEMPLSGMNRAWAPKGRQVFPYNVVKARRGVRVKIDTRRRSANVILIQQADPGAVIFEVAGRKTDNALGRSLGILAPARTRVLQPAVEANRGALERGFKALALKTVNIVNRRIR